METGRPQLIDPSVSLLFLEEEEEYIYYNIKNRNLIFEINGYLYPEKLQYYTEELKHLVDSQWDNYDTLILKINSGGGQVSGTPEFAELIQVISNSEKHTIAFTQGDMCSGAYWIGSACNEIVATGSSNLGSIGVVMTVWNDDNVTTFKRGEFKRYTGTDLEKEKIEKEMDIIYDLFCNSVAKYRGKTVEEVKATEAECTFPFVNPWYVDRIVKDFDELIN